MRLTSLLSALLVAAASSSGARAQHPLPAYPVQVLPLGDQPSDIAIGDVDEDGWPDVAVQTTVNGTLLLSDGHGVLRSAGTLPLGVYSQAVALADVDEDGHLDLVVIESGSSQNQLKVLAGDGQGAFELASSTSLGTAGYDLLVVDGNEDGHLDVVITGASPAGVAFAAGLGDGSFGPLAQLHGPGSVPWNVQAGDVDEDGHLDLVVSFLVSHDLWVLRGNGEGAFVPDAHLLDVAETRYMALGELDGDGDLDVVVSSEIGANQSLGWFPGDGSGGFLPRQVLPNPANDWGPVGIADFDGDGDNDVVLGLDGSYLGAFDLQSAPGVFAAGPLWSLGGTSDALGLGDLDLDGRTDLVAAGGMPGRARIFLGNTPGLLMMPKIYATNPEPRALDVGDLDGDGHDDVVAVGTTPLAQEFLLVLAGQADGSLGPPSASPVASNGDTSKDSLALHDLDGDGNLDVALIDQTGFNVIVRLGDGHLGFSPQQAWWDPLYPTFVTAGEVTGDSLPDLVTLHEDDARVSVLPGLGGGAFGAAIPLVVDAEPVRAGIADVDGDGDQDIAVAHDSSQRITLLHDDGGGVFTASVIPSAMALRAIAAGDLDGDGDIDLAVAGVALDIYRGDGAGGFGLASSQPFPAGSSAHTLRLADVDRDGRPDVLAGLSPPFRSVAWLRNAGGASFDAPRCHAPHSLAGSVMSTGEISGRGGIDVVFGGLQDVGVLNALITGPWSNLGHPLQGASGQPHLYAKGDLTPASPLKLLLDAAPPAAPAVLVMGSSAAELPFKGGTMVPYPNLLVTGLLTSVSGQLTLSSTWPATIPSGLTLVLQTWLADASGPAGFSASNGIVAVTP